MFKLEPIFAGGVFFTAVFTCLAFMSDSREWGCTFLWHACLVQAAAQTTGATANTAGSFEYLVFVLGIVLGVPVYSIPYYAVLRYWQKKRNSQSEKSTIAAK